MREFGPFLIEELLGEGASAKVYRARPKGGGPEVALKVIRLEQSLNPRKLKRFMREGEVAARLDHPGIVKVHSAGEWEGVPYLAYQLVRPATTLREAFAELDLAARVVLVREVALAVAYAHEQEVLHRDIKPENVLVAEGRAMVADFGLARHADDERLTATGAMVGTPVYMAPELLAGERPSVATEVWALGVVLFEAICGRVPFEGGSYVGLIDAQSSPLRFPPEVSAFHRAVCGRALALDPGERYDSCAALAEDLVRVESGEAPEARGQKGFGPVALVLGVAALLGAVAFGVARSRPGPSPTASPEHSLSGSPSPSASQVDERTLALRRVLAETAEGAPPTLVGLRSLAVEPAADLLLTPEAEVLRARTLAAIHSSVGTPAWSGGALLRLEALAAARLGARDHQAGDRLLDDLQFETKLQRLPEKDYTRALLALVSLDVVPLAEHLLVLSSGALEIYDDPRARFLRLAKSLCGENKTPNAKQAAALLTLEGGFGPRVRAQIVALARGGRVDPVAELRAAQRLDPGNPWVLLGLGEVTPASDSAALIRAAVEAFQRGGYPKRSVHLGALHFHFFARCARRLAALGERDEGLALLVHVPQSGWNERMLAKLRSELEKE